MPAGELILHSVLAILGIRLGLYCVLAWKRLRLKHAVGSSVPAGSERLLLYALPVAALLMAVMVVYSGVAVVGLLDSPAP